MNTLAAGAAMLILFGGQNLDGWIKLSGTWEAAGGAMLCRTAPSSIRSVCESDQFVLTFQYRRAGQVGARLFVCSRMTTGGAGFALTPTGLTAPAATAPAIGGPDVSPAADNEWIAVQLVREGGRVRAATTRADGKPLNAIELSLDAKARGFLRFECDAPGLELRDIRVQEPGFTSLFDGKSLDGWEIVRPKVPEDPGWVVEDGAIQCRPQRSSWLRTLRTYDDFILRLEYRIPPRGNSGVYVRAPIEGRVSRIGLEFQLLDDAGFKGRYKPAQYTGSIYDGIAPELSVPCPANQWNAIEILVDGQRARTVLNGIPLFDALLTNTKKDANAEKRPLATRRTTGFIGLQDHSAPVKFRNIRIRELP